MQAIINSSGRKVEIEISCDDNFIVWSPDRIYWHGPYPIDDTRFTILWEQSDCEKISFGGKSPR